MINKAAIQKIFSPKAIIILISLILVGAGIYFATGQDAAKNAKNDSIFGDELELNATGLDLDEEIENIGDVEKVIAKWIEANPEAILNSVATMQQKAAQKRQEEAKRNISSKQKDLFEDREDPQYVSGNYDISVVEFFDYNCGYCKRARPTIEALISQDKKVRVVFKELPILGPSSTALSKVALAVNMMDEKKYFQFHNALMKSKAKNRDEAINIAKDLGIDVKKLQDVLKRKEKAIEKQIDDNRRLAASVGINGTPAFVIGEELIPGAVDLKTLKEVIADQR